MKRTGREQMRRFIAFFEKINWKKIGRRMFCLPVFLTVLLAAGSTCLLILVFLKGWEETLLAYISYVLAFYTLTVVCVQMADVIPGWCRGIKRRAYQNRFSGRYLTDVKFKTHVSLYLSLGINLLYAGLNALSYYLYRSFWFCILTGYYLILAVMRYLLLRYVGRVGIGKDLKGELRRSRLCAVLLLLLNLILPGAVLMILYQNKGFEYHGILIYVMAMYTFYAVIHTVVDMVKYRKYNSPVMSTGKIISLCAALVSVMSLETAMLSQFGAEMTYENKYILIAATGGGISAVVVGLSVFLIVMANRRIRVLKEQ